MRSIEIPTRSTACGLVARGGLLLGLVLAACPVRADTLVLANGDRIEGLSMGVNSGRLRFATENFGVLEVDASTARVESGGTDKAKSAEPVRAPVYREGWGGNTMSTGTAFAAYSKPAPGATVSILSGWHHRLLAGYMYQSSQVDSDTFLGYYEGWWRGHEDEIRGYLDYYRATQTYIDGRSIETGDRVKAELRERHEWTRAMFVEGFVRYRHDLALGLSKRGVAGTGLGCRFRDDDDMKLAVVGGVAMRSDEYFAVPYNDTRFRPFAYASEELKWRVGNRFTLRQDWTIFEKLATPRTFASEFGIEAEFSVTQNLGVSVRYAWDYDVDNLIQLHRNQRLISFGVAYHF